ncbi:head-tail adaptor protein [Mesorhizobium sp. YC-39]|uniref:head-tail adaptor protein n=1 Tax=unclassified Mesorhizobium TaxID=325217 RepID=UPI0021E7474F|nr:MULTISPECIES: head-tail adaptor protein [unclassified Mesorhizobium]MCV3209607.1 head-tail adaptor protein [Mesorhizobium sp. YC-2]MCV3230137.1 head-tail adaptor protein [Mesorhizobium sp. YC-39]
MPAIGKLDRRVTVQRFTTVRNEFNEDVPTWADLATVWARKEDASDVVRTEILSGGQVGSFLLSHFAIRSSTLAKTITPVDRLVYRGTWSIKAVKETSEGRNRFIEITAVIDSDATPEGTP